MFEVTSVLAFIPDFNLLSCEIDNFTLSVTFSHFILKQKIKWEYFYNSLLKI